MHETDRGSSGFRSYVVKLSTKMRGIGSELADSSVVKVRYLLTPVSNERCRTGSFHVLSSGTLNDLEDAVMLVVGCASF